MFVNNSMKRTLGVVTLLLVGAVVGMAVSQLLQISLVWGVLYLVGVFSGGYFVVSRYCAKCPCKTHCPHIITGWLAHNIDRKPGPYTRFELNSLSVSMLLIVLPPIFWLIPSPLLLVIYLGVMAASVGMIVAWLCRSCANVNCPIREMRLKGSRS